LFACSESCTSISIHRIFAAPPGEEALNSSTPFIPAPVMFVEMFVGGAAARPRNPLPCEARNPFPSRTWLPAANVAVPPDWIVNPLVAVIEFVASAV
jgi:hypothetical protein